MAKATKMTAEMKADYDRVTAEINAETLAKFLNAPSGVKVNITPLGTTEIVSSVDDNVYISIRYPNGSSTPKIVVHNGKAVHTANGQGTWIFQDRKNEDVYTRVDVKASNEFGVEFASIARRSDDYGFKSSSVLFRSHDGWEDYSKGE